MAESLACGTPVLISDKVNIWREITAAKAGYVAPDDVDGATSLLNRWLATPSVERREMQARARAVFDTHFEAKAAAQDMLSKMQSAIGRSRSRR